MEANPAFNTFGFFSGIMKPPCPTLHQASESSLMQSRAIVRLTILFLGRSERLPVSCDTQVGVSFRLGCCLEIVVGAIAPKAHELAIIIH